MKCPNDSIRITGYVVTGGRTANGKLACMLLPCGHVVDTMVSETTAPRAVALYGSNNSTTPGQTPAGVTVSPTGDF